jgi:hypothetical protein
MRSFLECTGCGCVGFHSLGCPFVIKNASQFAYLTPDEKALGLIKEERMKQIYERGFTEDHDDKHINGELSYAAAYSALSSTTVGDEVPIMMLAIQEFLEERGWKINRKTQLQELIRAGALIFAEIERVLRIVNTK